MSRGGAPLSGLGLQGVKMAEGRVMLNMSCTWDYVMTGMTGSLTAV